MSTLPENPTQVVAGAHPVEQQQQEEDGDRNTGGNRWPREETMALLKIRSEMDAAFRDISPKAPLWEQVSRKLGELGYQRSAKKCKEKFENIYKYHRRTKEGRSAKPNAKTYRFFDQLEAFDPTPHHSSEGPPKAGTVIRDAVPCSVRFPSLGGDDYHSNSTSYATSSSSSSGDGDGEGSKKKNNKKKKVRKMFEGLMKEVILKQESLQRKFMEVLDKSEQDRMAREQAWKAEELARIRREREILAQERSIAAAKDEAVLAFLKKFAENSGSSVQLPEFPDVMTQLVPPIVPHDNYREKDVNGNNNNGGGNVMDKQEEHSGNTNTSISLANFIHMSSSRWPKEEVEALIRLRTQLDGNNNNSNNNGSNGSNNKGPLWEEISMAMKGIGYDRSAKRCKEKWENINKYFKRMKEKNKRKPEDSKTCPYYHHLEALYSNKKAKKVDESGGSGSELKPEELLMQFMSTSQEERQQQQQHQLLESSASEDVADRENTDDQNHQGMIANSPNPTAIMG